MVKLQRGVLAMCVVGMAALGAASPGRGGAAPAKAADGAEPLLTLTDEKAGVTAVAFSPDATQIAATGGDGKARIWEAATGKLLQTVGAHAGPTVCLAWSPDSKHLAVGGFDRVLDVWDAATGKRVDQHVQSDAVNGVAFLPDGRLVTACGAELQWWKAGTAATVLKKASGDKTRFNRVAASPEGEVIASDEADLVLVLSGKDGAKIAQLQRPVDVPGGRVNHNLVRCLVPLGNSELLLSDGIGVFTWEWKADKSTRLQKGAAWNVAMSPDQSLLVTAVTGSMATLNARNVDAKAPRPLVQQTVKDPNINDLAISSKGDRLAVANGGKWTGAKWSDAGASAVYVYDLSAAAKLIPGAGAK